jgi:hypothetical protein
MEIHVPFNEMNKISPLFENYAKNLVAGKIKLKDEEDVMLTAECCAIFQKNIPHKCKDRGSFIIPCTTGGVEIGRALLDLVARSFGLLISPFNDGYLTCLKWAYQFINLHSSNILSFFSHCHLHIKPLR